MAGDIAFRICMAYPRPKKAEELQKCIKRRIEGEIDREERLHQIDFKFDVIVTESEGGHSEDPLLSSRHSV